MSATDDDLRQALAQAAGEVSAPSDPVGRVRAAVDRRRRRRTRTRIAAASASAAGVLVAAVVLAPGQLPRDDAAPPATSPSPSASADAVLLTPEGLPGVELGSVLDVSAFDDFQQLRENGSGCVGIDTRFSGAESLRPDSLVGTALTVWLRDGVVVSLAAVALPDRVRVAGDVPGTWLGPTLRSPVVDALDLPGARLVKDDPLGDAGPEISNVVVDAGDGVELVFSDVPLVEGTPSPGRVTTLVLRTAEGRGCSAVPGEDVLLPGQGLPGDGTVVMDAGGTVDVRLGGSVAAAVAAGSLVPSGYDGSDPLGGRTCEYYETPDTLLRVWADDDVVRAVSAPVGVRFDVTTDPPVRAGEPFETVSSLPGAAPVPSPSSVGVAVDVHAAPGVRALVEGYAAVVVAPTTGTLLDGPARISGVTLYEGDQPADSLCTP